MAATKEGAKATYLFIAELNGYKTGTEAGKLAFGKKCYLESTLHTLNYQLEDDRSSAHENIWLQRLYNDLDAYYQLSPTLAGIYKRRVAEGKQPFATLELNTNAAHKWKAPLELDASASMLQYIGALLGDKRLLTMTNCIGDTLSDPWAFEGMSRAMFKHAATPRLYGSSKPCYELWNDWKHEYTMDQVLAFNQELATGSLGLADAFKEFIINNVKPKEHMRVTIANEEFDIACNRYRNVGEETILYDIYDTETASIRRMHHTRTKKVADLDQFRRYFVTLLIHNLDSQVANSVMTKVMAKYGWGIDIHDAFIVSPEAASDVRTWYAQAITDIYDNRATILSNYFASIGIGASAQGNWERVKAMVTPLTEPFKCQPMALK